MTELTSRRRPISASSDENPYWISFSDIMAGLLVIFILASVILILELSERRAKIDEAIQEIQRTNGVRKEILNEIAEELRKQGIQVIISDDMRMLHIPEDVLAFETRQYNIPSDSLDVVASIGRAIHRAVTAGDRQRDIDTIFVEGHTDSRPARGFMQGLGNWGLSTARATSVWKYWSTELEFSADIRALKNANDEPMFSVSGYADTRPLESVDDTPAKQRRNRRIDVRFSMRAPVIRDFELILDEFSASTP